MESDSYLVKKILNGHIVVTILVTLTATMSMVINGLFVGSLLGAEQLTAYGLANPIILLLSAVAGIFSNGGTIVCAKHIGRCDKEKVGRNFSTVMLYSVIIGIIYLLVCLAFADAFASAMGLSGKIAEDTAAYIRGIGLSGIPFLILQNLLLYLRMDGNQKLSLIAMIVTLLANTAFSYWSAAFTDMGLFGIGLSLTVSNLAGTAVCLFHFAKKDRMLSLAMPKNSAQELKEICAAGLPTAINRGSQTLKNLFLNAFLLSFFAGTSAVLILSVQTNVYQFLIAISTGYGIMIAMMCGLFYGDGDKRSLENSLKACLVSGFVVSVVAGIALFALAEPIASLFVKTPNEIAMGAECLRYFALSQPTSTVCLVFLYMYQAMGNLVLSTVISLTRGVGYVVLFSIIFAPVFGLPAVWISFFIADVLSILTIMIFIFFKTKRFPIRASDFILYPKGEIGKDNVVDVSISNDMDEVMGLADRMKDCFAGTDVPEDTVNRVSLCIEEMAGNVVNHAFDDGKKHFIDIRVFVKDGDVVIRMRDDGKSFNPISVDTEGHYGIKTLRAAAKNIAYQRSFGLNNLRVTV